jgi:hypothetical protein
MFLSRKKPMPRESDTTITFIGAGRYSDVFKVSDGRRSVIMKLSYYRDNTLCDFVSKLKKGDAEGARKIKNKDSIMVSSAFSHVTNALVEKKASPHFVFVYCSSDCRNVATRLSHVIPSRLKSSTKVQLKYNNVCFMEQFTSDMTQWIRGTSRTVKDTSLRNALFAVIYTLAVLQKAYPGFRHNDLSTNNVLVKKLRKPMKTGYTFGGYSYYISSMPVLVALSDYDFTHVPGHSSLANERIISGKYRVTETPNKTYDTHFFLKSVLKSLKVTTRRVPQTMEFLKSLPLQSEDRLDTQEIPGLEPDVLLRHPYFESLRVTKIPRKVDTYSF